MKGTIIYALRIFVDFISIALLARAVLSWFLMSGNKVVMKVYDVLVFITDPVVAPCQKLLSRFNTGPVDFSLILAYFLINIIEMILVKIIYLL